MNVLARKKGANKKLHDGSIRTLGFPRRAGLGVAGGVGLGVGCVTCSIGFGGDREDESARTIGAEFNSELNMRCPTARRNSEAIPMYLKSNLPRLESPALHRRQHRFSNR